MTTAIDTPAIRAARLTGARRAFLEMLIDADLERNVRPDRAKVYLTAEGMIDWQRSPLPGAVIDYARAEVALGGAA